MNDKVFALLTLVIGAVLGLASPVVLHFLTHRRESAALYRETYKAKIERLRNLFADALKELHRAPQMIKRDDVGQEASLLIAARLLLESTPGIRDKFNEAATLMNQWVRVRLELDPKSVGDMGIAVRTIRPGDVERERTATELLDRAEKSTDELAAMMRKHLQNLECSVLSTVARAIEK